MAGLPSGIKQFSLRAKSTPSAPEDEEYDDFSASQDENTAHEGADDVLAQLHIEVETPLPENILTSGSSHSVRFRESQPKGYFPVDVNEYQERVTESIKWYAQALHQRDKDIHRLATEIDRTRTDMLNQKFQMEILRGKTGKALVNPDGSLVTESQLDQRPDVALQVKTAEVTSLQAKLEKLQEDYNEALEEIASLREYAQQMDEHVTQLEQQILSSSSEDNDTDNAVDQVKSDAEDKVSALRHQLGQVNSERTRLERETISLSEQLEQSQQQTQDREQQIADLTQELTQASEEKNFDAEEIDKLRLYTTELENHVNVLEGQILHEKANGSKNTTPASALTDEERQAYEELQAWAQQVEPAYAALEDEASALRDGNQELSDKNSALADELAQISRDLENTKSTSSVVGVVSSDDEALRQRIQELEAEVSEQASYAQQMVEYSDQLVGHIKQLEEVLENASTQPVEETHGENASYDDQEEEQQAYAPEGLDHAEDQESEEPDYSEEEEEEEEEEDQPPVRRMAYAPELPEGMLLPSQTKARKPEFAPSYLGAPLTSHIRPEDL